MIRVMPLMIILIFLFLAGLGWSAEKAVINDQDDAVSYSVGHQVGRDLAQQEVVVNPDLVLQGILDAIGKKEPLLPLNQMIEILSDFRERIIARADRQKLGMRRAGEEFLAANAGKEGVVTLKSGLQYKVLRAGKGKTPGPGDLVTVNYVGKDINDIIFDSTVKGAKSEPVQVNLDKVIPGWLEGLQLMSEGAKWELYVPHSLAYKDTTPLAGQAVVFEIELLKVGQ